MLPFTNPWMLAAIAAVAIPLIIEWLFRRRKRQVELPTIRFLLNNKEQEKIRRQDRILLFMRSLAIFLLVMALARPFVQRGWLGRHRERKVLLVMDVTASMSQNVSLGTSFSMANESAKALVRALPKDGTVTVAICSVESRAGELLPPTTDLESALQALNGLQPSRGAAPISEGLNWATNLIREQKWERPEVYVFSDFQQQTWAASEHSQQVSQALAELKDRSELFLVDVGGEPKYNLILTSLLPKDPKSNQTRRVITTQRPVQFIAELDATGEVPPNTMARVSLRVNGGHIHTHTIDVSRQRTVVFDHTFSTPGEHLVQAEIVEGDEFDLDNERLYICTVPDAYRVLVLDDRAGEEGVISDSHYLLKAITPTPERDTGKQTDFAVKSIKPQLLADEENLRNYSVIVLTATRSLSSEMTAKLEQWVAEGGGLIVFAGPDASQYDYNRLMFNGTANKSLLPARLLPATQPDREALPQFGSTSLVGLGGMGADPDAGVMQYMPVATPLPAGTETLLAMDNGAPLVLSKLFGEGRVILCTTTAGHEWTYMASVPAFTVMFQELLTELVGNPDRQVNLSVGEVFRQPVYVSTDEILFHCPDGRSRTARPRAAVRPGGQAEAAGQDDESAGLRYVLFGETDTPGLYMVDEQIQQVVPRARFVVNGDSSEADLSRLTEGDFRKTFTGSGGRWVQRDESVDQIAASLHSLIELFPAVLWGLAALMAGESFLAWRFGRRRGEIPS